MRITGHGRYSPGGGFASTRRKITLLRGLWSWWNLVLALGLGCLQPGALAQTAPAAGAASRPAVVDRVASGSAGMTDIRAQIVPRRYTTIAAEIGARISSLPVGEAGSFGRGRMLVAFDCSVQEAQRDRARAELQAAEATLRSNRQLAELNSVGQLELDLSFSAVNRARAELNSQQALIEKCSIVAPFSGRVAEQKVREQQFVQPGQALLDILDDSSLELEFLVPSAWLRWLKIGFPLKVSIDETQKTYPAR
ncbi:MAG: hypothetical protein RI906_3144, partial [Pseudomonadota bacterium]